MSIISRHHSNGYLSLSAIAQTIYDGLEGKFINQRVLVLIPDHTRSFPLPFLFRTLVRVLSHAAQLDFMVALGTHPPLNKARLLKLVGVSTEERNTIYKDIHLLNHAWNDSNALKTIGVITQDEIKQIAGESWHPSLGGDIQVQINKHIRDYDHILILGPTFPHEVAGFSGGAKYLFPGISGPEMINTSHWLGALFGVVSTIGIKDTPVRAMIHAATRYFPRPVTLAALVVDGNDVAGIFIGDLLEAWNAAADLSAQRHISWKERLYKRVLSCAPPMYDELWTAGKAMYKIEPVVAKGGEVIIYAPHLETISDVHGRFILEVGYHTLSYILDQWELFKHIPLNVLAHSTHVRGSGVLDNGIEKPNVQVTLASKIPPDVCDRLNLGYQNPTSIDVNSWKGREDEGILYIPKAGEVLYRVKGNQR